MMKPGGFAKPRAKKPAETSSAPSAAMSQEQIEDAWRSINNNLIQNRCWLCDEVFQRGKIKKVFMVEHLLRYLENLLKFVKERKRKADEAAANPESVQSVFDATNEVRTDGMDVTNDETIKGPQTDPNADAAPKVNTHMISRNLLTCWASFRALDGDKEKVAKVLQKVECEVWMSGLICARSKECATEYLLLVPDGKVSSSVMREDDDQFDVDGYSKTRKGKVFRDKNGNVCPPGCDCDNPWQFIQAALMATEIPSADKLETPGEPLEDTGYIGERQPVAEATGMP